jgi:hypothetical protein
MKNMRIDHRRVLVFYTLEATRIANCGLFSVDLQIPSSTTYIGRLRIDSIFLPGLNTEEPE